MRFVGVSMLMLVACGSESGGRGGLLDGSTAGPDAFEWPEGSYRFVRFRVDQQPVLPRSFVAAYVGRDDPGPGWCVPDRIVDNCTITECENVEPNTTASAGTFTVTGDKASLTLTPSPSGGYYDTDAVKMSLLATGGTSVHFHAQGGAVPTFDQDVTMPGPIDAQPGGPSTVTTLARGESYTATWANGSGPVRVRWSMGQNVTKAVECVFDASAHMGIVPAAVLDELPRAGATITIGSSERATVMTSAGPVGLSLHAQVNSYPGKLTE